MAKVGVCVQARNVVSGMRLRGHYRLYNRGQHDFTVHDITVRKRGVDPDWGVSQGFGGTRFKTTREALQHLGVKSLLQVDTRTWDVRLRTECHDDDCADMPEAKNNEWFYLYQGRWARGSGAEPMTLVLLQDD